MFVHGSKHEELFKIIPKDILPAEYGGNNICLQELIDHWEQKILSYAKFFEEDDQYGVDEELRVKPDIQTSDTSLGVVGSFRKLVVD